MRTDDDGRGRSGVEDMFTRYRSLLFSIAYRMLGGVMDAEDIVQETFLRWQQLPAREREEIESPKAYLTTVATRLCIDHLRLAYVQRERYVGPWLPEPLIGERAADPADMVALDDSLSMAFLVLLESLSPVERAVFLLHDVFGYPFAGVAEIVGQSEGSCRQLASRARKRVEARRPRFAPSPDQQRRLTERFAQACLTGDMDALLETLAEDITLWSDSGGKVVAARNPIHGASNVARLLLGIVAKSPAPFVPVILPINGNHGIVTYLEGEPRGAITLDVESDRIRAIRLVVSPDKLRNVPRKD